MRPRTKVAKEFDEWGQLPVSSFTPVPVEQLDWDKVHAEMRAIELKLARIKMGWWELLARSQQRSQR